MIKSIIHAQSDHPFTSMIVPLVMIPIPVYIDELGFFFTPKIGRQNDPNLVLETLARFNLNPIGLMNRSYFGAFLVNPGSTKVIFVMTRFQALRFVLPDLWTLKASFSLICRTFGIGTSHLP